MPAIVHWPNQIPVGVTPEVASTVDIFATSLALAGVEVPSDRQIDG